MVAVLAALAVAALLAVGLFALDRMLAARVEQRASAHLSGPFTGGAVVHLAPGAFLPQALRGRYRGVRVRGTGLQLGELGGVALDGILSDLRLPLRSVLTRTAAELPCGTVAGQMVVPYASLAGAAHIPGLSLRYRDGRLQARAALPLTQLGTLAGLVGLGALTGLAGMAQPFAQIRGDAHLSVRDGGVWLRLDNLDVGSLPITSLITGQITRQFEVPIPVPPLPWGLSLTSIEATASGLVLGAEGHGTTLRRYG